MVKKDKIRKIQEVFDSYPKITYNKLKKIVVEKEKLMAAQTFTDALKEGVEAGVIIREEGLIGKRKVVYYSKPEFAKQEEDYFRDVVSSVDSFTQRLEELKKLFPNLNNLEKGQILFSFNDLLQVISSKIGMGWGAFGSPKFLELFQSVTQSSVEIVKMILREDPKRQLEIWNEFFLGWNDIEQDNIEEIDELLEVAIAKQAK